MIQLTALKSAKTLHDVATLLGFKPAAFAYVVLKLQGTDRYQKFDIPKRYGGTRQICAPLPKLKLVQERLSQLLQDCVEEINEANGRPDQMAHGFKRDCSIITNAVRHRNRRYVFNADLEIFFGTINFGRVRGFFIKDKDFSLNATVATLLAQIACYENALPQGSPCSPVISNLIGHVLDIHLVRLASRTGCTYSRYVDDLTFSTNKLLFPSSIAKREPSSPHEWMPGKELTRLVTKSGFVLNPKKTRMQYRDSRQEVTGLIVNKKVNVRCEYRHTVRAMVHRYFTTGTFDFVTKIIDEKGVVVVNKIAGATNQLHGMLGFIDGVDLYNKKANPQKGNSRSNLTSKELMYRQFLMFKEFYTAKTAVIICEGKTDNVYIVHAIRALASSYPQLATINADGTIKLNVRIFRYSGTSTGRILGISGGSAPLGQLMRSYSSAIKRFTAPGQQNPIIVLIDNDEGADPIYNTIKDITKIKPKGTEQFVHVAGNLYVSATPIKPGTDSSMIEDFFDGATLSIKVDGKTFDPTIEAVSATNYGKMIFAHKVVRASADKIDFNGFNQILSNMVSVIDAHAKAHPPLVTTA